MWRGLGAGVCSLALAKSGLDGMGAERGEDNGRKTEAWASFLSVKHFHNIPSFQPKADSAGAAWIGGKGPGINQGLKFHPPNYNILSESGPQTLRLALSEPQVPQVWSEGDSWAVPSLIILFLKVGNGLLLCERVFYFLKGMDTEPMNLTSHL